MGAVPAVQAFQCPHCESLFSKEAQAATCTSRCSKQKKEEHKAAQLQANRELIANSVRLEATSLSHAIELIIKYAKEHFGFDVEITSYPNSFSESISNTHCAPLGKKTNWGGREEGVPHGYPGWSGYWKGTVKGKIKKYGERTEEAGISDVIRGGFCNNPAAFLGFHTGTGSGGSQFSIDGKIFIEDFPNILPQHTKYLEWKKLVDKEEVTTKTFHAMMDKKADEEAKATPRYVELATAAAALEKELGNKREEQGKIVRDHFTKYQKLKAEEDTKLLYITPAVGVNKIEYAQLHKMFHKDDRW